MGGPAHRTAPRSGTDAGCASRCASATATVRRARRTGRPPPPDVSPACLLRDYGRLFLSLRANGSGFAGPMTGYAKQSRGRKQGTGLLRRYAPRNDPLLIRRNLDQAAVGVAAVDRAQRAARALLDDRALFDGDAAGGQMRDHLVRAHRGEEAQVVAAGRLMVAGEPLHLVGVARAHIDLLVAELE